MRALLPFIILACTVALPAAETPRRPNLILIMADDLGYECIGANGGTSYKAPVLDQLAATGMRFEHCHVQPLCTPTRVQLMTGISNVRNYINFGHMDSKCVTFGNILKQAGYATCITGKWQLGQDLDLPKKFGFDEYCLWQHTRRPPRYANAGLEINGEAKECTGRRTGTTRATRSRRNRVDARAATPRQVDLQAAFAGGLAGITVSAALHGEQELVCTCEIDRRAHVRGAGRLHHECGVSIDGGIQHATRLVIARRARQEQRTPQAGPERLQFLVRQRDGRSAARDCRDFAGQRLCGRGEQAARQRRCDRYGQRRPQELPPVHFHGWNPPVIFAGV